MDLAELAKASTPTLRRPLQRLDSRALVAQLGSEVATTLSSALERVVGLATTGRIDMGGLHALREEIDLARRAGIMGQQVMRLANGHVQVAHEPLDLTAMLLEAIRQRGREINARGIEVRHQVNAAEVLGDATLNFSLLQTSLDWAFEHTVSRVDIQLDRTSWPTQARLCISFRHRPADEVTTEPHALEPVEDLTLNTMSWRLLQQTASMLSLSLQRKDSAGRTELKLQFPDTLTPRMPGVSVMEGEEMSAYAQNSQPLAGRHVVVLAARRELRNAVREALRPMGLMVDFVVSVEEAQQLCADGVPHAVIYDSTVAGDRFDALREQLMSEVGGLSFIRIADQGKAFEVINVGGRQCASVGCDALQESLPAALLFELTRNQT